jgi:hypothetical protein
MSSALVIQRVWRGHCGRNHVRWVIQQMWGVEGMSADASNKNGDAQAESQAWQGTDEEASEALRLEGESYVAAGELAHALHWFSQALEYNPQNYEVQFFTPTHPPFVTRPQSVLTAVIWYS